MQQEFWLEAWHENQIGFHNEAIHPYLQRFWPTLNIAVGSRVLVPLCGKSSDMLWLLAQGCQVIGIELSEVAVAAFFAENNIPASVRQQNRFTLHEADGLQLYCGDFFALHADALHRVNAVYDRAALVALPPEMRTAYAGHMRQLLESGTQILLVAFDYPQHEMAGPPFSVPNDEVQSLYGVWCRVEQLRTVDILEQEPRFRERGLTRMEEQVYRLTVL